MTDNEKLKSSDLFNFDKWTYNVLREDVENNFFQKIFTFKKYRTRYWIAAVRKGYYLEKRDLEILCHRSYDSTQFYFEPAKFIRSYDKIKYWNNSQEPMDIIQHLRAKLDVEALPENLVFSSDEI